ncbi:prolyl oligopeptidase family serine peptidase [Acetobacteraceae bacterium ESL0709]|nr:prolyl oligopeptidase family serine peptidase [Acetobacteraceae bacterium ESL0697]MDF7677113.1 prolyl oligopeptidase family serine peptidase [Acetobacteraceae bacterium ESL0709]
MTRKTRQFSEARTIGRYCFWLERRPEENGRSVVVMRDPQGHEQDLTESDYDVGTNLHEYGGGAWVARQISRGWEVVFTDRKKKGVWSCINGKKTKFWPDSTAREELSYSYAGFYFHPQEDEVFCVRECQSKGYEESLILSINSEGVSRVWAEGSDFYASPCLSSDGQFLAWIQWQNPSMPWDETQLCVHSLGNGKEWTFSGQGEAASFIEPQWGGTCLYVLSDQSRKKQGLERFWSPVFYEWDGKDWCFHDFPPTQCEIGLPLWVFGQSSYHIEGEGCILARGLRDGVAYILRYSPEEGWKDVVGGASPEMVPFPVGEEERYFWIDVPEEAPPALAIGSLTGNYDRFRLAWELPGNITKADISVPQNLSFVRKNDPMPIRGFFYPPAKGDNCFSVEEPPPLIVLVHGGPTGQARAEFSFKVQWWTSRGFAVIDVNYRGSTGFGRCYREALKGEWGVADVQDCCLAVKTLIEQKKVDPRRCVIRGSSAGGLTVLSALASSDLFRGGTVLYGVTDLMGLVKHTHRFEACYFDSLVGPLPESESLYKERSPINWPEKLGRPVLFFHGEQDCVVPLEQAETLAKQMKHALFYRYPDEGHGFRSPVVIAETLQRELTFYENLFSQESE